MTPREEGRKAASEGRSFATDCPYTFDHAGVDQTAFNAEVRPKMNEWFAGWKAWLDERGLGFTHQPLRTEAWRRARARTEPENPK